MLPHPTHDRLIALGLVGMAKAFEEHRQQPAVASLTFEERLGLLVDREAVERESKRLVTRLKFANLRQNATIEDLNTKAARVLDRALFAKLATGDWIGRRQDLLITGKTGTGKSWLACALGNKACRDDRSVLYYRVPRLLDALALARGDGRYVRLLKSLARVELLILDDWGLAPLTSQQGRDLLEIVDDRHGRNSTRARLLDRKSTRLNSSHQIISYAVFCLKKKNTNHITSHHITTGPPFATKRKATTLDTELNMYIAYYTTPHPHLTHT